MGLLLQRWKVALFTRAWIEIFTALCYNTSVIVALFTRAWIEITFEIPVLLYSHVALFTRAWIEIEGIRGANALMKQSPSSRGRGLKYL